MKKDIIARETKNLMYFAIIGRILIIIKDILLAGKVGVCCEMDNYLLALSTIMLPTIVISDGIILSMIPLLQIIKEENGEARRLDYTNNLINISLTMAIILMTIGYIFAPNIISLFGPGFDESNLNETINLFRIGLPIVLVSWFRAVTAGYLQSEHAFRAGAKGLISNPLIFIIYLVFLSNIMISKGLMLKGLMAAGIIAIFTQFYLLYSGMKKRGFKYKWKFDLKDKYLKKMMFFLLPVLGGLGINEVNKSIDNAVASTLPMGSIAELNYANEVMGLFLGIIVVAIVTVIFPALSESHNKEELEDLKEGIRYGIDSILKFATPITIILLTMSAPIVKLVYERGAFDAEATFLTAQDLTYYSIGFIALTFIPLITRAYYSIQMMRIPFFIGILMFGVNLGSNLILAPIMGGAGIALSTSISAIVFGAIGLYGLEKRLNIFKEGNFTEALTRFIVGAIIMFIGIIISYGIIATSLPDTFINNILAVGLSSGVGVGLYILSCKAFSSDFI